MAPSEMDRAANQSLTLRDIPMDSELHQQSYRRFEATRITATTGVELHDGSADGDPHLITSSTENWCIAFNSLLVRMRLK